MLMNLDEPTPGIFKEQIPLLPGEHTGIPHARAAGCGPGIAHTSHAVDVECPTVRPGDRQGHDFAVGVCI